MEDEAAALAVAASTLGLELPSDGVDRLVLYLDLLERWNGVYNLTAVRERRAMRIQHLNDSLSILAALRRGPVTRSRRILDVGSGAGLPGVVIALGWPEAEVVCVDAVGKKTAFVAQAASALGLGNLVARHARVESMADEPFDLVTARAFSALAETVALTRKLLAPSGIWALAKGRRPDDEITALPDDAHVFHVERLQVTELDAERHLVWIRPGSRSQ